MWTNSKVFANGLDYNRNRYRAFPKFELMRKERKSCQYFIMFRGVILSTNAGMEFSVLNPFHLTNFQKIHKNSASIKYSLNISSTSKQT